MTRADEECVLAEVQEMRLVGKYARKWRRHTVEAGPARTAALKGIWDGARRVIAVWIAEGVEAEVLTIYGASLQILVTRRIATVRRLLRPAGTTAYALWRTVALAQRWRTRAALSTRRWHGSVDEGGFRRRAPCVEASWCDLEARRFDAILRQRFTTFRIGVAQAREGADADEWGIRRVGLIAGECVATSKWMAGGGRRHDVRRAKEMRDKAARMRIVTEASRFRAYRSQTGNAKRGLSGRPFGARR